MTPSHNIERAIRNGTIIRWLDHDMPGTGNSIDDLTMGYASFIGCPIDEVRVPLDLLVVDSDFLDFIGDRYMTIIERWNDEGL